MKLYVVNVGANTADAQRRGVRSPVLPDGTFELVPIKEPSRFRDDDAFPRYCDLPSWTGRWRALGDVVPDRVRTFRAHADPDFDALTYGDIEDSRAANLARVVPGDELWFLARLWQHDGQRFTGPSAFFFVGVIEVEHNLRLEAKASGVPDAIRSRVERNAHWRRMLAGDPARFRVLLGSERSHRFRHAIRVTPDVAAMLFAGEHDAVADQFVRPCGIVTNKNGRPATMRYFGSITRTIQSFVDTDVAWQRPFFDKLQALASDAGRIRR